MNGSELAADQIFINVGARAAIPPTPGLDQVPYLTNSSMMDIDFLPPHLVIMGGSYIGLEFAQAYRRFGSEVTVIELGPRLISREEFNTGPQCAQKQTRDGNGTGGRGQEGLVSGRACPVSLVGPGRRRLP